MSERIGRSPHVGSHIAAILGVVALAATGVIEAAGLLRLADVVASAALLALTLAVVGAFVHLAGSSAFAGRSGEKDPFAVRAPDEASRRADAPTVTSRRASAAAPAAEDIAVW